MHAGHRSNFGITASRQPVEVAGKNPEPAGLRNPSGTTNSHLHSTIVSPTFHSTTSVRLKCSFRLIFMACQSRRRRRSTAPSVRRAVSVTNQLWDQTARDRGYRGAVNCLARDLCHPTICRYLRSRNGVCVSELRENEPSIP